MRGAEEPRCAEALQGPGVPGRAPIPGPATGWALAIPMYRLWEGAGWVPVKHPPSTPPTAPPRVLPSPPHPAPQCPLRRRCTPYMQFSVDQGDPRVEYALPGSGTRSAAARSPYAGPAVSLSPPVGPAVSCCRAPELCGYQILPFD